MYLHMKIIISKPGIIYILIIYQFVIGVKIYIELEYNLRCIKLNREFNVLR